jgi:type III pantothenate kinase
MSVILSSSPPDQWIALAIGNSRLHWGLFYQAQLQQTCHTSHLDPAQNGVNWQEICPFLQPGEPFPELWVASVVSSQTQLWHHYPNVIILERADIPLQGMYATLGLDRAIALWSAGITYGWPTLVVDGGTALTFTGADAKGCLVGGAILPGLSLQLRSLRSQTAKLPWVELPTQLPMLWATNTEMAMQSGVVYGAIAGIIYRIEQWLIHHPKTQIILTGGDASALKTYLNLWYQSQNQPDWIQPLKLDSQLLLQGIAVIRYKKTQSSGLNLK